MGNLNQNTITNPIAIFHRYFSSPSHIHATDLPTVYLNQRAIIVLIVVIVRSMLAFYLRFLALVIRNPSTKAFSSMADTKNKWNTHTFTPTMFITSVLITTRKVAASFCESLRRNHITAYLESIGQNSET